MRLPFLLRPFLVGTRKGPSFLFAYFFFGKKKYGLTAAENKKYGDNKNPDAVVIKKVAKAVVVHKISSLAKEALAILAMK